MSGYSFWENSSPQIPMEAPNNLWSLPSSSRSSRRGDASGVLGRAEDLGAAKAKPCRQEGKETGTCSHRGPTKYTEPPHPLPELALCGKVPCPKRHVDQVSWGIIRSVQLFQMKAVISLTWNCIRITPVPDGPELEQNLKKKALLQFPVHILGDFTGIPCALCKSTWTLINFIPLLPAVITTSHVSQRHTAMFQYPNKDLNTSHFVRWSPFSYFQISEAGLPTFMLTL